MHNILKTTSRILAILKLVWCRFWEGSVLQWGRMWGMCKCLVKATDLYESVSDLDDDDMSSFMDGLSDYGQISST
eukprot:6472052-Amphidinium_carterae.2